MVKKIFGCIFLFLTAVMIFILFSMLTEIVMLAVQILKIINSSEINLHAVGRVIGEATFWGIFSTLLFVFSYFGVKWVGKSKPRKILQVTHFQETYETKDRVL